MNLTKSNVILAIAAAVLAVPTYLQLQRDAGSFVDLADVPLMFDGFTAENVGSLVMLSPKAEQTKADPARPEQKPAVAYDQLLLVRNDRGFQVAPAQGMLNPGLVGAPVARDRVETDVFTHLRRIRMDRQTLVRADATDEQLAQCGLDDAQAFVVRAADAAGKNLVAELLVGKPSDGGQVGSEAVRGVYVRRAGSRDVVLYEFEQDAKTWRRDVDPANWIDKLLFRLEPSLLDYLAIRNQAGGAATFVFQKKDGKASWVAEPVPSGPGYENLGAVRQVELEGLVQRLRHVAAQEFRLPLAQAGNLASLGLNPAGLEIEARWREGGQPKSVKLQIGAKVEGKNEYYMTCSESPFLMTWPASLLAPLERDPREYFDPAQPPKDAVAPTDGGVVKPGDK